MIDLTLFGAQRAVRRSHFIFQALKIRSTYDSSPNTRASPAVLTAVS